MAIDPPRRRLRPAVEPELAVADDRGSDQREREEADQPERERPAVTLPVVLEHRGVVAGDLGTVEGDRHLPVLAKRVLVPVGAAEDDHLVVYHHAFRVDLLEATVRLDEPDLEVEGLLLGRPLEFRGQLAVFLLDVPRRVEQDPDLDATPCGRETLLYQPKLGGADPHLFYQDRLLGRAEQLREPVFGVVGSDEHLDCLRLESLRLRPSVERARRRLLLDERRPLAVLAPGGHVGPVGVGGEQLRERRRDGRIVDHDAPAAAPRAAGARRLPVLREDHRPVVDDGVLRVVEAVAGPLAPDDVDVDAGRLELAQHGVASLGRTADGAALEEYLDL